METDPSSKDFNFNARYKPWHDCSQDGQMCDKVLAATATEGKVT